MANVANIANGLRTSMYGNKLHNYDINKCCMVITILIIITIIINCVSAKLTEQQTLVMNKIQLACSNFQSKIRHMHVYCNNSAHMTMRRSVIWKKEQAMPAGICLMDCGREKWRRRNV